MTAPASDRRCGTCKWWGHPDMQAMGTVYGMDRSISYIESIIGRTEDAAS